MNIYRNRLNYNLEMGKPIHILGEQPTNIYHSKEAREGKIYNVMTVMFMIYTLIISLNISETAERIVALSTATLAYVVMITIAHQKIKKGLKIIYVQAIHAIKVGGSVETTLRLDIGIDFKLDTLEKIEYTDFGYNGIDIKEITLGDSTSVTLRILSDNRDELKEFINVINRSTETVKA